MSYEHLFLVCVAFALGGILKGAIGAGAPILAVPIMAILVDVPFAVAVFIMPNILSNAVQGWQFRAHIPDKGFALRFALAGLVGAGLGTIALAGLSSAILTTSVAVIVLVYVTFRLIQPGWTLDMSLANRLAVPVGTIGGVLQGATGLSAPVSITFVNALRLERKQFIATMSLFFSFMALAQLPVQIALGIMTTERFAYSVLASLPLVAFMPVGGFLARHVSREVFDRIILSLLTLLAFRLLAENFY
ncbi:sulfite exporter TauE/SafE family protein [Phaeobacter marinintestinus]|uniref:sulfite exporter TauE/SafE family protein n=1 Tax=Falsiphaeobacter marinintestinus TaxID=1492905 RepID=UPI0011B69CA7|nr:sulfite exporter TauE/SafE family protein [Phaeobacter marinintestinus]